jgi:hypothetical protein
VRYSWCVPIQYLNTDLDLVADHDLTALVKALEACGVFCVHHVELAEGFRAGLELVRGAGAYRTGAGGRDDPDGDPDPDGDRPWGFHQGLSGPLLASIAAAGAGLRVTIYPAPS